jgi:MFS family permease
MLEVLRHRDFAIVSSGQLISVIGDAVLPVAMTIGLLQRREGVAAIGGALAMRSLAKVVALVAGGVLADRFRRTRVMISADLLRVVAVLAVIALLPHGSTVLIGVAMFVSGLGESLFRPAYRAVYPQLVPARLLQAANSVGAMMARTAAVAGPGLAGVLVTVMSPATALWVDVASFAVSIASLLLVREVPTPTKERATPWRQVTDGVRAVGERRWIRLCMLAGAIQVPLAVAPWLVLMPAVSLANYGDARPYTWSMSAYALGAILGAMVIGRLTLRSPGVLAQIGVASFALIMLAMMGRVPVVVLVGAHLVAGAGLEIYGVLWYTALQKDVPRHLLARITSLDMLSNAALMPLAYGLVGAWAQFGGRGEVLLVGAIACVATTLPLLLDPGVRRLSSVVVEEPDQVAVPANAVNAET